MKKITKIGTIATLTLAFAFMLSIGSAMATTETNVEWDGSGHIDAQFEAGDDAEAWFSSTGNLIEGKFNARDYQNNPYNYGVDTVKSEIDARVNDGGEILFGMERNDSKESTYGDAGQSTFTSVWSNNGYAGIIRRAETNFAEMNNGQYPKKTGHAFASGSEFEIVHDFRANDGDGATVYVGGMSGNANLSSMTEWARDGSFGNLLIRTSRLSRFSSRGCIINTYLF